MADRLIIRGAREHNLRDVNLDLPRDAMIVFTGLSGSGKSSLAFDTIFAEGQRRYVESLSSYARQFLGQMDKPDVDFIEGLSPAVSIDQKSTSRNPRSTVGTITEVYDYLRLLFARTGIPHCPICGERISKQSPQQIVDRVLELDEGTRFMVLAPVVRGRKGEYVDLFAELQSKGYARARVDGVVHPLTEPPKLKKQEKHTIEVVVDRLSVKAASKQRLTDSVESALGAVRRHRAARLRRPARGRPGPGAPLLRAPGLPQRPPAGDRGPRAPGVLLQRAVRRLPGVHRPGHQEGGRPGAAHPGRGAQPARGRDPAVVRRHDPGVLPAAARGPGQGGEVQRRHPVAQAAGPRAEDDPVRLGGPGPRPLPQQVRSRALVLHRLRGCDPVDRAAALRHRERLVARQVRGLHARGALPDLWRHPAQARGPRGDDRRQEHRRDLQPVGRRVRRAAGHDRARRPAEDDRRAGAQGDQRPAAVPGRRRPGLPVAGPRRRHPLRRRGAADPARHPDRVRPGRRAVRAGRAVDRPAPARQPPADRDPGPAEEPGQHADRGGARRGHHPDGGLDRRHRPRRR